MLKIMLSLALVVAGTTIPAHSFECENMDKAVLNSSPSSLSSVLLLAWAPTPTPPRPDPTLEPIAADEPIPVPGFPPLPERLDLGFGGNNNWAAANGSNGATGAAPGMSGSTPTYHQHYGHLPPGAFAPGQPSGAGGHGYYKARYPSGDVYNSNTAPGAPAYTGASARDLKALGREPKINDRANQDMAPDVPTPVVVNQAATQDLSLPEDDFAYRHPNSQNKNAIGRGLTRVLTAPLRSGLAGVRF